MALIGYARVSKNEQNPDLQLNKLKERGCIKIFVDKVSGAKTERKELEACLAYLRKGDVLVVYKLDRLGRSLKHLMETVNGLKEREIEFSSLTESIDTTTPIGKLFFHMMGAFAEFERDLIRERTMDGLIAARQRGHKGGRKSRLLDEATVQKIRTVKTLHKDPSMSIGAICKVVGIEKSTFYRYLKINLEGVG